MEQLFIAILFCSSIILYFLPCMIAENRHHRNLGSIAAVNILLGWTFIGWVVSLAWALSDNTSAAQQAPGHS